MSEFTVAVFRPNDARMDKAVELLNSHEFRVVKDSLLEIHPTENELLKADFVVLTSITGAELAWSQIPEESIVCAIGPKTRDALIERGVEVDIVPDDYSSMGLVDELGEMVGLKTVEIARSDKGDPVLVDGLMEAGGFIHETILYTLEKPESGGRETASLMMDGEIDAVLFSSSMQVEYLMDVMDSMGIDGMPEDVIVGAIGQRTADTASERDIGVSFISEEETFESLVEGLVRTRDSL